MKRFLGGYPIVFSFNPKAFLLKSRHPWFLLPFYMFDFCTCCRLFVLVFCQLTQGIERCSRFPICRVYRLYLMQETALYKNNSKRGKPRPKVDIQKKRVAYFIKFFCRIFVLNHVLRSRNTTIYLEDSLWCPCWLSRILGLITIKKLMSLPKKQQITFQVNKQLGKKSN